LRERERERENFMAMTACIQLFDGVYQGEQAA